MDPEIEELKKMVAKSLALAEDTNRTVHKIRRSAGWNTFFSLLYWVVIIGALGASYFYVSPYITKLQQLYHSFQTNTAAFQQQSQ